MRKIGDTGRQRQRQKDGRRRTTKVKEKERWERELGWAGKRKIERGRSEGLKKQELRSTKK